jgi:Pvc16 N-terminal domain
VPVANFQSIAAAGKSLERYLTHCFEQEEPVSSQTTKALLVRTVDLDPASNAIPDYALSIFLYRVDYNRTMRSAWSGVGSQDGRAHLPLDLYFLLTPWATNAEHELSILGKAMLALETTPTLGGPLLDPLGGWSAQEALQVCLADISTEDMMRTFDSLPVDYKLSVLYVARVVRIDQRIATPDLPVTTLVTGIKPEARP